MKIIELDDITVSYRENVALKNITLNMERGNFLSVIGPNGAGKTTLLTAINGLGTILSGSVTIFGKRVTSQTRQKIGYVPQNVAIDPRSPISVHDVVMIGRLSRIGLFHHPTSVDREIVDSTMKLVGIDNFSKRPIGHLSSGEQQKVSLARALAQEPEILLLDEPTSSLDPRSQMEIIQLIDRIHEDKALTVVFVTHILSHIPNACKEAVLMKKGKITWSGPIIEAMDEERLADLYDCPIEALSLNRRKLNMES
jgi:ABC-type Mn2+/Zn2+ transport system ATPase subunit